MFFRLIYTILITLFIPLALMRLFWRSQRLPAYREHWQERLALAKFTIITKPIIHLHCVSVGETRAVIPLIGLILKTYPHYHLLITHTTPTSRAIDLELPTTEKKHITRCYFPYDIPFAIKRFLQHYQPKISLFVETEVWLNYLTHAQKSGIPTLLINARLSEKSLKRYLRFAPFSQQAWQSFNEILTQTQVDQKRIEQITHNTSPPILTVMGNLKQDTEPSPALIQQGLRWRERWQAVAKPIFLIASTRQGEEKLILDNLPSDLLCLLIIVPRHPDRFEEVAQLLKKYPVNFIRRSQTLELKRNFSHPTTIILGDSMGEMTAYYSACDLAFIGGSLVATGGQNLLEALKLGKPVLTGPHTFNFQTLNQQALQQGCSIQIDSPEQLWQKAVQLLNDPKQLQQMSLSALAFTQNNQNRSSEKVMEVLKKYL